MFGFLKSKKPKQPKAVDMFDGELLTAPRPESNTGFLDEQELRYDDPDYHPRGSQHLTVLPVKRKRTEVSYRLWLDVKRAIKSGRYKNQDQIAEEFHVNPMTISLIKNSKSLGDYRQRRTTASYKRK